MDILDSFKSTSLEITKVLLEITKVLLKAFLKILNDYNKMWSSTIFRTLNKSKYFHNNWVENYNLRSAFMSSRSPNFIPITTNAQRNFYHNTTQKS